MDTHLTKSHSNQIKYHGVSRNWCFRYVGGTHKGHSLRILVVGERFNVTGEYFERGSTSE